MPRRKTIFQKGEYYHIYNRGTNREPIFYEQKNYLFLLKKIQRYHLQFDTSIIAYCLMPNHYHFLLRQNNSTGISEFIQSVFNSYTKAFNNMYNRSGTLFEGRYKDVHIDHKHYLIHLCAYIHRNPLEAGLSDNFGQWPYSNLPEWINKRNGTLFNKKFRDLYFQSPQAYLAFLEGYDPPEKLNEYLLANY